MPHKCPVARRKYQLEYQRKWRKRKRKSLRRRWSKWYASNKSRIAASRAKRRRLVESAYQIRARRYHRAKTNVIRMLGGKCACCGERQYEFLTIDHTVPGVGYKRIGGGLNLYAWLTKSGRSKKSLRHFQILCYNCNGAKRAKRDCPHKTGLKTLREWEKWAWSKFPKNRKGHFSM